MAAPKEVNVGSFQAKQFQELRERNYPLRSEINFKFKSLSSVDTEDQIIPPSHKVLHHELQKQGLLELWPKCIDTTNSLDKKEEFLHIESFKT